MIRRAFFLLLLLIAAGFPPQSQGAGKPNILFILADDWGRFSGFSAKFEVAPLPMSRLARTPNFDRLCEEGVYYANTHVSAPSCTPSRGALLTGRHFWRTGRSAILQGAVWDPALPSWPLLLKDAGYHIGKTGKVWSPGVPADAPFGGQAHAYEKAGMRFNRFSETATKLVADGKSLEDAKRDLLDEVRGNFNDFLKAREKGKPFCYWFGPTNTHRKWMKGSGKALWGVSPDSFEGRLPSFLPDVPEVREDMSDYFGEIAALDSMIGALREELEKSGEAANTLIVITGDNGAPGFPKGKNNLYTFGTGVCLAFAGPAVNKGRVFKEIVSTIDLAPTLLEAAGVAAPAGMDGVSLWNSVSTGKADFGRRLVLTGRERHVADARVGGLPYPQRALRTQDHLYIINFAPERTPLGDPRGLEAGEGPSSSALTEDTFVTMSDEDAGPTKAWMVRHREDPVWKPWFVHAYDKRPAEELYILAKDPDEIRNVVADPAHSALRSALRRDLMKELERTGDPRATGTGDMFDKPPFAGPVPDDAKPKTP